MKFKLFVTCVYGLAFIVPAALSMSSSVAYPTKPASSIQERRVSISLDVSGKRGLVLFDHKLHEAEINPDPDYPHKAPANLACIGCHHTVRDVAKDPFQKCSDCHREEGNPLNPDDRTGIDLNSREVFHRMCVGCHRAGDVQASNERFTNVSFTKCSECHDRGAEYHPIADPMIRQPVVPRDLPIRERPAITTADLFTTPRDEPFGFTGPSPIKKQPQETAHFVPIPDRWRIGFPEDPRFERGAWYNPYRMNVLKGDYPILGQHNFLVITAESDTLINARRIPVPSDVVTQRPESSEFFGKGDQFFFRQNFVLSVELFHGDTSFKPIDWRVRISPNFNINYLLTRENAIVNIDPRRGKSRTDGVVTFQELFGEARLGDTTKLFPLLRGRGSVRGRSPYFDTTSIRVGIQQFVSDFRGFIFNDFNLGARLFGNAADNRYQFNAAYFYMLEKDTNSELNTRVTLREWRDQIVFAANLYRQDTIWKGYTTQFSYHYNNDRPSTHFDENSFLVRPALIGDVRPHGVKAHYIGWAGDGKINRMNINHAFYQALGHDTRNPIAGQRTDINAQMAAAEISVDRDWLRFKGSFFFASGDRQPLDDKAKGFDAIFDFPEFAGGKFSFWNSQGIRLTQTGVGLVHPESLLPSLRSQKIEGQANFVNPGLFLYNLGVDAELTPKLRGVLNFNYLHFHHAEPLRAVFGQADIRRDIGVDYGLGIIYRPLLNENAIFAAGFSALLPGSGFKDIFSSNCEGVGCGARTPSLYSAFVRLKFTY